ncbi:tetratricopeptide repeat protein [Actinospica durhamensis]|uniref:Tetratricopeptide repeat protein n=1 Tax=Actinospica durhamensis TaxID=1508375 RepID=A0A941EIN0_9ACTN|nr:FxSxx-COOH system tetratricopeptide repeat protein [Actinospica durhamensis]MBR7833240.1 tetratricopeptide repeat protein [Actinospica durhamensis]
MTDTRTGEIVTFYSFKGGTGRTMALANVAWILASGGKRVLTVDWDLEAPGLHEFFHPFLRSEVVRDTPGVIDLIGEYKAAVLDGARDGAKTPHLIEDVAAFARIEPFAVSLEWEFPDGGTLDFMSSGRQNDDYTTQVGSLDWDNFYALLGGSNLLRALRAEMKRTYDYVLIDSRTGFSDTSDICIGHLPDTLVDCFTFSTQSIRGAAQAAHKVTTQVAGDRKIRVLPVPMRVENAEKRKADAGRALAKALFADLPTGLDTVARTDYWSRVEIPYQAFYAFEETLAVFADEAPGPLTLLGAYQRLADVVSHGEVTALAKMDPRVREHWSDRFERRPSTRVEEVWLDFEPEDEIWAEWIEAVLVKAGIKVSAPPAADAADAGGNGPGTDPTVLAIVSPAYREARRGTRAPSRGATGPRRPAGVRALYISDQRPLDRLATVDSQYVVRLEPAEAAYRITRLLGADPLSPAALAGLAERYPENEPRVVEKLLGRNGRFTGRTEDLRALRSALRSSRTAVVGQLERGQGAGPVAVGGMGGVGKTQLALEYAHRYRSQYDMICWVSAGQPQFVDAAMVDLARVMTERMGANVGVQTGIPGTEIAQNLVRALGRGEPTDRWLLIFDNAEDPASVRPFLPRGECGHIIVTSRDRSWGQEGAHPLDLNVFTRQESIRHLRERAKRPPTDEEAYRVAEWLGDFPLAIDITVAWLTETGNSVQYLLEHYERHGTRPVPGGPFEGGGPAMSWSLALDQVAHNSPAAYRLLELCAIMSSDGVALDLLYSSEMATALTRLGPEAVEDGDVARLVQQLNRFALIKLDPADRQLQIHRLLQDAIQRRTSDEEAERIRREVHWLLAEWTTEGDPDEQRTWARYRMLWPHLDLEKVRTAESELESVRNLQIDRVRYQWIRGDLPGALLTAERAEAVWSAAIAANPSEREVRVLRRQLLHLRFNKANALRSSGLIEDAYGLDRAVLEEQRQLLGPRHRHTLMTAGGLAADLRALGSYDEALRLSRETYDAWLEDYGPDYRRSVDAANNLAVSLRLVGSFDEARDLDEIAFEWRNSVLSSTHERTLSSANCIGLDLRESGRYQEAVTRLREAFDIARYAVEPSVRVTLQIQVNLASSLRAIGQVEEAGRLLDEANERFEAQFSERDPDRLVCRLSVANNRYAAEDVEGAERELSSLLARLRGVDGFGPLHPLTLLAANNRAAVLRALGAGSQALEAARETRDLFIQAVGDKHPYTLAAAMNLAVCLAESGALQAARELDAHTVEALSELLGAEHPDTLRARANLALTRIDRNEPGATEDLREITAILGQQLGRVHPTMSALQKGRRAHRLLDGQPI